MLSVCCEVVHLVAQHEIQVLKQLYLFEVELLLVLDKLLETDLHLAVIGLLGLLNLFDVSNHLGISISQRGVLVLSSTDLFSVA